jgi:hypothetical protein
MTLDIKQGILRHGVFKMILSVVNGLFSDHMLCKASRDILLFLSSRFAPEQTVYNLYRLFRRQNFRAALLSWLRFPRFSVRSFQPTTD